MSNRRWSGSFFCRKFGAVSGKLFATCGLTEGSEQADGIDIGTEEEGSVQRRRVFILQQGEGSAESGMAGPEGIPFFSPEGVKNKPIYFTDKTVII
jgi:hypothetical protein